MQNRQNSSDKASIPAICVKIAFKGFSKTNWNILQGGIQTQANSQTYDEAGNIQSRTDLASLTMNYVVSGKPHVLSSISGVPSAIPADSLGVTYTDFRKIATLNEGNKAYELTYGVDNQRRKSVQKIGGTTRLTRYYLGDYEEEISPAGNVRKIHYLSGGAILIRNNGVDTLLYAYSDNQGSLTALTNETGTVLERYAYDPWGRRLDPNDWRAADTRTAWRTNRGYTGHEHLDPFGIINMNGRVYDPATAMFLSPDPFIQEPGNWQNYNRYGYCLNNPTNFTDPSGYRRYSFEQMAYTGDLNLDGWKTGITGGGRGNDSFFADYEMSTNNISNGSGGGSNVDFHYTYYDPITLSYRDRSTGKKVTTNAVAIALSEFGRSLSLGDYDTYFQLITGRRDGSFDVTAVPGNKATGADLMNFSTASAWSEEDIMNHNSKGGDYLQYEAKFVNSSRTVGNLVWYNSEGQILGNYPALSGSGKPKYYTIPEGNWNASFLNTEYKNKFSRYGISFRITMGEDRYDPLRDRETSLIRIHPASSLGTEGCIGLVGDSLNILDFFNRYANYSKKHGSIKVSVIY